jgi:hypothetical protein
MMFHAATSEIGSLLKFNMYSPFAIFGLLLCMSATHVDELPVIKDSDAAQYVGKKVEVRGLVISVTASPFGTTFINFGREYPEQTFAGFIAADSKIGTDQKVAALPGKNIGITGTIELSRGKPDIQVTSTDQIKGLDSHLLGE